MESHPKVCEKCSNLGDNSKYPWNDVLQWATSSSANFLVPKTLRKARRFRCRK